MATYLTLQHDACNRFGGDEDLIVGYEGVIRLLCALLSLPFLFIIDLHEYIDRTVGRHSRVVFECAHLIEVRSLGIDE